MHYGWRAGTTCNWIEVSRDETNRCSFFLTTKKEIHMNFKRLCFAGVMVALFVAASTAVFSAGISGTKHDFSARSWGTDQICIFCHTPHNAQTTQLAPLWNHVSTSTAAFTPYASTTLNIAGGQTIAGTSKACMSCHDGTVALDSYGTRTATGGMIGSAGLIGIDLSNDHPVGFTYNAALVTADGGGLRDPGLLSDVKLFGGNLECASCHSVHDNTNTPFLRASNAGSGLCLKCHIK
jgi:predicted CXXCH cytochrome family protein